jgi:hypothetical protein
LVYRDIWFYDLKVASHLLYGEDVRHLIPWDNKDIPVSSGLRLLFEKIDGLLGVFSSTYLERAEITEEKKKILLLECYKTFVEICTALCILVKDYEPKYADRVKVLEKIYSSQLSDLAEILPDLPQRVKKSTNFKLRPEFANVDENPIALWFDTRQYLNATLIFYLGKIFGTKSITSGNLHSHLKRLARCYYIPFLQDKFRWSNGMLLDIAGLLYQALTNLEYMYVILTRKGTCYLRPFVVPFISPSLKFFPAEILVLFSLRKNGTVDMLRIKQAADQLRYCIPMKRDLPNNPIQRWDAIRKSLLEAYSLYRGFHLVK